MQKVKEFIKKADAIVITAGAGMGVDSGLPDFRGDKGFWKAYPVIKKLGLNFMQMANPTWFESNPKLAWAFYGHRLNLYRDTTPHLGFKMLLDLVKSKNSNYFIFTSNVDGQFQKAGFSEEKIYEVHGSIHYIQCTKNCTLNIYKAPKERIEIDKDKFQATTIPKCQDCGEVARPNILMFGDFGFNSTRSSEQSYRYQEWLLKNRDKKVAIIEIGAGEAVPTVRVEGEELAQYFRDAKLIRINPQDYNIPKNLGIGISLGGLEGIKKILD